MINLPVSYSVVAQSDIYAQITLDIHIIDGDIIFKSKILAFPLFLEPKGILQQLEHLYGWVFAVGVDCLVIVENQNYSIVWIFVVDGEHFIKIVDFVSTSNIVFVLKG